MSDEQVAVGQVDRDAACHVARLTGWKGVADRLERSWEPERGTSEAELLELLARHRLAALSTRPDTQMQTCPMCKGQFRELHHAAPDTQGDGVALADELDTLEPIGEWVDCDGVTRHSYEIGWALRDDLSAALRHPAQSWQGIENAPKNRKVLAGYWNVLGNWRTVTACYHTQLPWSDDFDPPEDAGEYAPDGWYEESETHETLMPMPAPTHWQALPAPPTIPLADMDHSGFADSGA